MRFSPKPILEFAEIAEKIYSNKYHVNLGKVCYCVGSHFNRSRVVTAFNLRNNLFFKEKVKGGIFFTSRGERVILEKMPLNRNIVILSNEDSGKPTIVHELAHVFIKNFWEDKRVYYSVGPDKKSCCDEKNYLFARAHFTINEGVAETMEEEKEFSRYYSVSELERVASIRDFFKKTAFSGSVRKWMGELGPIDFENDRCFYVIGNLFIKEIWKKEKDLKNLVTLLRNNLPTEEEFIEPEKYLKRMKL